MTSDVRTSFLGLMCKRVRVNVVNGQSFCFHAPFSYKLFLDALHEHLSNVEEMKQKKGIWECVAFDSSEMVIGEAILLSMLGIEEMPTKTRHGSTVTLCDVRELAFCVKTRFLRVRCDFQTQAVKGDA